MERLFRLSAEHGIDNHFLLHYGENLENKLYPGQKIVDPNIHVGVVGNGKIRPDQLQIRKQDREPIRITVPETYEDIWIKEPGKSGVLLLNPKECGKTELIDIVQSDLEGFYNRRHHLHSGIVKDINLAGWEVYWAPLQLDRKILHVRIISERTLKYNEDPTNSDLENLANALNKIC